GHWPGRAGQGPDDDDRFRGADGVDGARSGGAGADPDRGCGLLDAVRPGAAAGSAGPAGTEGPAEGRRRNTDAPAGGVIAQGRTPTRSSSQRCCRASTFSSALSGGTGRQTATASRSVSSTPLVGSNLTTQPPPSSRRHSASWAPKINRGS